MAANPKQDLLRQLPSVSELLETPTAAAWLAEQPRGLVTACIRDALAELRQAILNDQGGHCGAANVTPPAVLERAAALLDERLRLNLRRAINATGIILHTGLGRAVWAESVVDSMTADLKGYVTLAIDPSTGLRSDRDGRVEGLLCELTGAEAATVVNNNAAATMLVLAAVCAGREVVVSRGQLIEIGGSFRLPEVMAQSGCRLVEVGATNRTHARDYERAITDATAALLRVHPSNFRIVGFTSEVSAAELSAIAQPRGLTVIDDLGAGALVDLAEYGLPHEPTVQEALAAGADLALFSTDKLIGASQGGAIVGRRDLVERCRKHPLMRAFRPDKTCLMALERTLRLFREPARLAERHPLYRTLAQTPEMLAARAEALAAAIRAAAPKAGVEIIAGAGYLGSGSLPAEALPTRLVALSGGAVKAEELARRLRLATPAVFGRIETERVLLDVRTLTDADVPEVAAAVALAH